MRKDSVFTSALRRVRPAVLLWLVLGNAVALAAGALWLLIPDSHVWELILSILLGGLILAALLACSALGLRALRTSAPAWKLWKAALTLAVVVLVALAANRLLALAEPGVELRAGLWNSQISAGLRHTFTYQRLIGLQHWLIAAVRWVLLPALLAPFALEAVSYGARGGVARRSLAVLAKWQHWAVAIIGLGVAAWLVPTVVDWHPSHTVAGEVFSAALRLGLAFAIGIGAALLLLAVDSELLARATDGESQVQAEPRASTD